MYSIIKISQMSDTSISDSWGFLGLKRHKFLCNLLVGNTYTGQLLKFLQ